MHRMAAEQRVVYFIRAAGMGLIKIGVANCVHARVRMFGQLLPFEIEVLGVIPCGRHSILEQSLHGRFKHLRTRGEWFREEPELLDFIAAEASPVPPRPRPTTMQRKAKNAKRREQYRARVSRGVAATA